MSSQIATITPTRLDPALCNSVKIQVPKFEITIDDVSEKLEPRDLFCQMDALRHYNDDFVWKEVRRWVKFEEEIEEKGKRWSKPHVSSICMQYLTELHQIVVSNPCLLDLEATSMFDIVDILLEQWQLNGTLNSLLWNHVKAVLLKRHKHQHVGRRQIKRHQSRASNLFQGAFLSDEEDVPSSPETRSRMNGGYQPSTQSLSEMVNGMENGDVKASNPNLLSFGGETNRKFKRKIPDGAEVMNVMVGEVEELTDNLCAFVRLREAKDLGKITEVDLPTRFLFILLVPKAHLEPAIEAGRCMGALMTDEIFREIAYIAEDKTDILSGLQEFISQTIVLPPGSWDPSIRIEPPAEIPTKESRKPPVYTTIVVKEDDSHDDPTLERTGRVFGGLIADVKRKLPHYKSDFTDSLHIQCVASFIYLFLATLTPNVTFGGLLSTATEGYMGTIECILAASITGVIFALFAGQPLNILGSTGPMLVLEMILFKFCKDQDWDFMPIRVWVGLWTALLILIIVAFDLSSLVRYITRFTEECFACLIALIFIYQAFKQLYKIGIKYPVQRWTTDSGCFCIINNFTIPPKPEEGLLVRHVRSASLSLSSNEDIVTRSPNNDMALHQFIAPSNCTLYGGILTGTGCDSSQSPDVLFMSIVLFFGTFIIARLLVSFKKTRYFSTMIRQIVSDFSVLIAIVVMVGFDAWFGVATPKLNVPSVFKPTKPGRGWLINPISDKNPWWLILVAVVPALLTTILIFMDQQITSVIVNRKENKLKKGGGYHLDMLVVAVLIVMLSFLGLPWYVAATVSAMAHVMSLRKESECTAPGEKPTFLGVREQRVTALLVGVFSGFAVLITSILKVIPMPVLYGVFLYMGVASLKGMQLKDRFFLLITPQKYQPDYKYLRHVPLQKVHIFTGIQIGCLAILWIVKSVNVISIGFPIMVLGTCFIRKGLELIFTDHDLKWLDDLLPGKQLFRKHSEKLENCWRRIQCFVPKLRKPSKYIKKKTSRSKSMPIYTSQQPVIMETSFPPPIPYLQRTISQESVHSARNQDIFEKRATRKLSLLSLPTNFNYLEELEKTGHDLNANRKGSSRSINIYK
ncbi:electrogenic sodium bicarbonate cotransporter 1-like [Mytilus galloprovincialis]|uniref:electrogenic sodium bicarbonate cotransporter 1-like n=1 Tax=Mytilus galloprovincialis TaxID=29158 RepID=UPI003F7C075D